MHKKRTMQPTVNWSELAQIELESGHSVVIDAGFGTAAERARFARLAATHQADFIILFVQCLPDEQERRLYERSARKDSVSDGRVELLDQQKRVFEPPDNSEGTVLLCSTDGASELTLNSVYEMVKRS